MANQIDYDVMSRNIERVRAANPKESEGRGCLGVSCTRDGGCPLYLDIPYRGSHCVFNIVGDLCDIGRANIDVRKGYNAVETVRHFPDGTVSISGKIYAPVE